MITSLRILVESGTVWAKAGTLNSAKNKANVGLIIIGDVYRQNYNNTV